MIKDHVNGYVDVANTIDVNFHDDIYDDYVDEGIDDYDND